MYAAGIDGQESKFFPFESLVCLLIELLVEVLMNLVKEVDFKAFASSAEAGSIAGGNGKVMMRMPALDHAKGVLAGGVLLENLCEPCPKNRLVTKAALAGCGIDGLDKMGGKKGLKHDCIAIE